MIERYNCYISFFFSPRKTVFHAKATFFRFFLVSRHLYSQKLIKDLKEFLMSGVVTINVSVLKLKLIIFLMLI